MKQFFFTLLFAAALTACGDTSADNSAEAVVESKTPAMTVADKPEPKKEKRPTKAGIGVGDKAPGFVLKGTDGQEHSFKTVKDANGNDPKGFIVTFTCNTCPYAVGYETRLKELHDRMSAKGYPVIAIQPNDTDLKPEDGMEGMIERKKERDFNFVYLLDEGQKVYPKYGARKTPEIFLVDANYIVRYHGAIDDSPQDPEGVTVNYVESAIEAIEAGKEPDPADVKAIGCSIKTKKS